ncbi:MAG: 50S ribosomal protein L4 [Chloroflexi bacterium]|nr:50S ribosomal protein L4 [Chloroflexota bacterium]
MKIDVYNMKGELVGPIEVSDDVFGVPFNEAVVHQAMLRQLANRRLGTADTKKRGEVTGSGKKLFAQKHTGRARRGDRRSPMLKGGGVAFGPHPRSYRQDMPRKMRRLALKCALSAKLADGELRIVDKLELKEPKTSEMIDTLVALGVGTSVIIATDKADDNLIMSARNIDGVKLIPARLLNVGDLLSHKALLMTQGAVRTAEELWSQKSKQKAAAGGS